MVYIKNKKGMKKLTIRQDHSQSSSYRVGMFFLSEILIVWRMNFIAY